MMYRINVNFEKAGIAPLTLEDIECGQSLLEVCLKHGIELRHDCGGVCGCSTCHIYVNRGEKSLEEVSRREQDFIKRAVTPKSNSRLSCQCLLLEDGKEVDLDITIPEGVKALTGHLNKQKQK